MEDGDKQVASKEMSTSNPGEDNPSDANGSTKANEADRACTSDREKDNRGLGVHMKKDGMGSFLKDKRFAYGAIGALAIFVVIVILLSTHVICFHENWSEATCTEPRRCIDCGKTEGEPLGHEWIEATCTEPKTCMRCGATEGSAAGHKTAAWSTPTIDFVSAQERSTLRCEVCGEVVDEKAVPVTSFIEDGKFVFSPSDFCTRLESKVDMEVIDGSDSDLISYALVEDPSYPDMCAMLSFSSMDGQITLGDAYKYDSSCNPSPILMVDTEKTDSAEMLIDFVLACDPSLSRSDVSDVAKALAASVSGASGSTEKNGIEYLLTGIDTRILFRAVIK